MYARRDQKADQFKRLFGRILTLSKQLYACHNAVLELLNTTVDHSTSLSKALSRVQDLRTALEAAQHGFEVAARSMVS